MTILFNFSVGTLQRGEETGSRLLSFYLLVARVIVPAVNVFPYFVAIWKLTFTGVKLSQSTWKYSTKVWE